MVPSASVSRLEIPNDIAYLTPVLAYVGELARAAGFTPEEARQIEIAVEEGLSNAIQHGYEPGERASIHLECEQGAAGLTLRLRDKGIPFDPDSVPVYDPALLAEGSTAGLGTFLMRRVVDEVAYRNLGREGKELVLRKHKASARVDALAAQPERDDLATADRAPSGELSIRPPLPEEAIEISRCAYRIYGYGYEDYIYYPERILEMQRDCVLHPLVAVGPDGEIAGHLALKRQEWRDVVAEVVVPFVRPEYRGTGVFRRLLCQALDGAGPLGLRGVYARSPQGLFRQFGFRPCGIQGTAELVYRSVAAGAARLLYPPARHREMIAAIYGWLGLNAEMAEGAADTLSGETLMDCCTVKSPDVAAIRVSHAGSDAPAAVAARARQLQLEGCREIYLYLDLEDPSTGWLEYEGFRFSGVLPGGLNGWDSLVLQRAAGGAVETDSPEGARLAEYVGGA